MHFFHALLVLCATCAGLLAGQHAWAIPQSNLTPAVEYLEDPGHRLTLDDVRAAGPERFRPLKNANLGYSSSIFWLRIPLAAASHGPRERLLEVAHFDLDELVFHAPGRPPVLAGLDHPVNREAWPHRLYVFPLSLPEQNADFYLQVRSSGALIVPLTLWQPADFVRHAQSGNLLQALYYGGLLVLAIYNLLIFVSLRERSFLLYSLFATSMALGMFALNGFMRYYLWPAEQAWPAAIHLTLGPLTIAFALYFTQSFLQTRTALPRLHWMIHFVAAWACVQAVLPWLGGAASLMATGFSLLNIAVASVAITAGIFAWRAGNHSARFFLLAWGILSLGSIVSALHRFGLVPSNLLTAYAMQLSSSIEMVLLSFALAERIRLERLARETAQAETLDARQALVQSLRESEATLERTVAERTAELNQSLQNERELLDRYVRFGALIAHEFRNPLAIIKGQLALIDLEGKHGQNQIERRLGAIAAAASRLGKLFEEWLQSDRLRRPDLALNLTTLPLAGWLEDVVADCRDCHPTHEFVLLRAADLPDVQADKSMLRGAINNLIDNAAKYAPTGTVIRIETHRQDSVVGISVSDEGPGIPPESREAVFADYVRAAPESSADGLGLGLAFVKRVVDLHRGWIEMNSDTRAGNRFCLWLPLTKEDAHAQG